MLSGTPGLSGRPDKDYDITVGILDELTSVKDTLGLSDLREYSYDPTNGLTSSGDIWRIRAVTCKELQ